MLVCLIIICSEGHADEITARKSWYLAAKEYIDADNALIQHSIDKKKTFTEDYNARLKAEEKLLTAKTPSETELLSVLNPYWAR